MVSFTACRIYMVSNRSLVSLAVLTSWFSPILGEDSPTDRLASQRQQRIQELSGKVSNERVTVSWSKEGDHAGFSVQTVSGGSVWKFLDLETGKVEIVEKKPEGLLKGLKKPKSDPAKTRAIYSKGGRKSPDGKHQVEVRENEVFLNEQKIEIPLEENWIWTDRIVWAPDSSRFAIGKRPDHPVRQVHYVRSSPEDEVQPQHFSISYPKPGDPLNVVVPVIVFTGEKPPIEIKKDLVANPFDLRKWGWRPCGTRFVFEFIERGFGSHRLIEVDTEADRQRVLIDESDEKFVFVFGNSFRQDLKGGDEILWRSERDGWNHLYLIHGDTGKIIRQLTKGAWVVREVIAVNEEDRYALISMSGFYAEQDPYHLHYAKVDLDSGELVPLTDGDGHHEVSWSPDGRFLSAKWSRVDHPPVHEIRRVSNGELVATLAEASGAEKLQKVGWQKPMRFVTKDRNGKHDIHGFLLRPSHFDPGKTYPVIEAIYAGPHGSFTPKGWRTYYGAMSEMADAGFLVVKLDALGTNHRGKEFQQVAYQNLIDSGFPDRIKWIRALAEEVPQMDLERVGIYGGSAGGQSTLAALLTHGDFYRAGAADCGCHDNRMDKIWWNEQWMDWPVGPAYEANSNLTHIGKLRGALLLTVGELDKNVDPSSTYQVVNALVKADKDFEYFMIPGAGHGVGESPYLRRKRIGFFQRHLGVPEPKKKRDSAK